MTTLPPPPATDHRPRRPADERTRRLMNAAGDAGELGFEAAAAAAVIPANLLRDDEIVILMLRPSPIYIVLSSLGWLLGVAAVALALAWVSQRVNVWWTDVQALAFGVLAGCIRLAWQTLEWWSRLYVLTDRRMIVRRGVVRPATFETPLREIDHVSVFAQMRERVCGLGSIGFASTRSDYFEAAWLMLRQPFAVHRIVSEAVQRYGRPGPR